MILEGGEAIWCDGYNYVMILLIVDMLCGPYLYFVVELLLIALWDKYLRWVSQLQKHIP